MQATPSPSKRSASPLGPSPIQAPPSPFLPLLALPLAFGGNLTTSLESMIVIAVVFAITTLE
jgi:hypothetical protein